MLSPSEGQEIYERIMRELDSGRDMQPDDVAALMQAAESGYAPAQNAYAHVLSNVEGNILAAVPWYCKALQQGDANARNTLRELYATEPTVRAQVSQFLSVEELINLRKPRKEDETTATEPHSPLALVLAIGGFCLAAFVLKLFWMRVLAVLLGGLLAMWAESCYQRNR